MKHFRKHISVLLLIIFSLPLISEPLLNNFEKIGNDLSMGYDRYGRKSKKRSGSEDSFSYFWRSALVPGWGEYKLGLKKEAAVFFLTDVMLIAAAAGFNYYSGMREDEYKDYAELYAGVDPSGKPEGYWVDIANYDNTDDYNDRRNIDRYFIERYEDEDDRWNWVSEDKRKKYDEIRISAETGNTWFYYSLGGIALNHFLSALNASGKASGIKGNVIQTVGKDGKVRNELKITYDL